MSDIRGLDPQGNPRDVAVTNSGAVFVQEDGNCFIFGVQSTGAISLKTNVARRFPNRPWKLRRIAATFSSAPTTSENLTLTQNPGGLYGPRPSVVLFSKDVSVGSITSLVNIWEELGLKLLSADEVTLAHTNSDARTVTAEIVVEVL